MNPTQPILATDPPTAPARRDFRQEVTTQVVEMLEKGTAPWQKPWETGPLALPFNPTSERSYRGGNALHLMAAATREGFNDPRWLTYRQAHEEGWQVRQGEKGTQIEYWQLQDRTDQNQGDFNTASRNERAAAEDDPGHSRGPIHRVYRVFNAQQIEGIPPYQPKRRQEWQVIETGEQILQNSGARIAHDQNDRAFYDRSQDSVHLPAKAAFPSASNYYGTALHELAHWSGHPSRLNRQTLNESYRFGDANYAKEELRAELTSVFLAAERGIPHNPERHAAYVGTWISALKSDKNEIFRAAKDAHAAADFLLGLEKAKTVENTLDVQVRQETAEHVAAYERGTGTVNLTEKETATEHHQITAGSRAKTPDGDGPVKVQAEKILDGEVNGRKHPSHADLQRSFSDAQKVAKAHLGESSRLYAAETDSGRYRGEILGETEHHLVQQLGAKSAAAHPKHMLPDPLAAGQSVSIQYSNDTAQTKPFKAREKARALAR